MAVLKDQFSIELVFNESAFETELYRCGYYPLMTNKPKEDLSIEAAMMMRQDWC